MACYFLISLGVGIASFYLLMQIVEQELVAAGYNMSVMYPVTAKQKIMVFNLFILLVIAAPVILIVFLNLNYRARAKEVFINTFYKFLRENI